MSSYKPTIAIAGLTGSLGPSLLEAFSALSDSITLPIRAISRSAKGESTDIIKHIGVDYASPEDLEAALKGVDVVVDVLNGPGIDVVHKALIDAAQKNGVKVFFPSKFGADYRVDDIYGHPSYALNKEVVAYAEARIPKVVRVYLGLFNDAIWTLLFPTSSSPTIEGVGSGTEQLSITSARDVARSVAQLSLLAPDDIPAHVFLSGSTVTYNDVGKVLGKEVHLLDLPTAREYYRELVSGQGHSNVAAPSYVFMLKCFVGEGWVDYSKKNHNELVNPGESRWKWAHWTEGRPE